MTKGGKRYANMERDGNWFTHLDKQQSVESPEACTSTGNMLAHGVPQPTKQGREKYPQMFLNSEKKIMGRKYPFSEHDNRAALKDAIDTYTNGFGRKKFLDERRQHNSQFCLRDDASVHASEQGRKEYPNDQAKFLLPCKSTETQELTYRRRFPRSHLERSRQAAIAQAGKSSMWFGRHDLEQHVPLHVLAVSNQSPASQDL